MNPRSVPQTGQHQVECTFGNRLAIAPRHFADGNSTHRSMIDINSVYAYPELVDEFEILRTLNISRPKRV